MFVLAFESPDVVVLGGGSLLVISIAFAMQLMRQASSERKDQRDTIVALQAAVVASDARCDAKIDVLTNEYEKRLHMADERNRRSDRRVDLLITACRRGGIDVPDEVWKV